MIDDFYSPLTKHYFKLVKELPFKELAPSSCQHCKNRGREKDESYWLIRSFLNKYEEANFKKNFPDYQPKGTLMMCDSCHTFMDGDKPEKSPDHYYAPAEWEELSNN